jgi:hypothetical protein
MTYDAWRLYFERVIEKPDAAINLAEGALILAADEYPDLEIAPHLAQLDAWAEMAAPRVQRAHTPRAQIAALTAFLFGELAFAGNRDDTMTRAIVISTMSWRGALASPFRYPF